MTASAKARIAAAIAAATTLTPRIVNATVRAGHASRTDADRIAQIMEARGKCSELLGTIMLAEEALKANRREVET